MKRKGEWQESSRMYNEENYLREPYAVKVACTVLRGGKIERSDLSQYHILGL